MKRADRQTKKEFGLSVKANFIFGFSLYAAFSRIFSSNKPAATAANPRPNIQASVVSRSVPTEFMLCTVKHELQRIR